MLCNGASSKPPEMNLAVARKRLRLRRLLVRTCPGTLVSFLAWQLANASCNPPPSMKARIQTRPTAEAYAGLGAWYGDQKQFVCAAEAYANAFKRQPNSSAFAYLWGLSLSSGGQLQKAVDPLQQAVRLNPSDIRPHLVLAATLDRMKRTVEGEAEWRAALAIEGLFGCPTVINNVKTLATVPWILVNGAADLRVRDLLVRLVQQGDHGPNPWTDPARPTTVGL